MFSPSTAWALASATRIRFSCSACFTCTSRCEGGRLLADGLLLFEFGDADRLLTLGFAGADLADLRGVGHLDAFSRSASATRISPSSQLVGHVAAGLLDRLLAAFWPMASM